MIQRKVIPLYQIKIDFEENAILVPKEIVGALGSPLEINFIVNPENHILGIIGEIDSSSPHGKRTGRPRRKSRISDNWDETVNAYRIEACRPALLKLSGLIPGLIGSGRYVLPVKKRRRLT